VLAIYDAQGLVVPNGGAAGLPADISQMNYSRRSPARTSG
jgi:hypothetical protein